MRELGDGIHLWQARHPEWAPGEGWDEIVTSYALDDGEHLLVVDPLAAPAELIALAAKRRTSVIVTCPWHRRDAEALAERLGADLFVPPPYANDPDPMRGRVYRAGERLELGVEAFHGLEENDLVLWVPGHRALIAGDTLIDRGEGLIFPGDWAARHGDPDQIRESLLGLLALDVSHVLPTHGLPSDRAALELALSQPAHPKQG